MAKAKTRRVASLKGIGRQIGNVEKKLKRARSKTTPAGRRELDMQIKDLAKIKEELEIVCRHGWFVEIPLPLRPKR